jgi:Tfp pilus assembly protein PilO
VVGHYQKRQDLKMFMELLLSLTTVAVFAIFAIRPTLITIAELVKEVQGKKQTITIMNEKIDNLNKAQALYEEERTNIDLLKTAIPKKGEPEVLIRQIEGEISLNPVKVLSITLGEVSLLGEQQNLSTNTKVSTLPEGAEGLSFSISSSSDYPQLALLIQGMERLRRPFKIDTIFINSQEKEETKELILVINARSPYLKGGE